jgi:hypothetical protein
MAGNISSQKPGASYLYSDSESGLVDEKRRTLPCTELAHPPAPLGSSLAKNYQKTHGRNVDLLIYVYVLTCSGHLLIYAVS